MPLDIDISRRNFLMGASFATCCALTGIPTLSFASAATEQRLLVIILRGGMDGLAAIPAIGDADYHKARGSLALDDKLLLDLDGYFAMNAAMPELHQLYRQKELLVLHAAASPYRERSHFEAQDLLENGTPKPHGVSTGWLGRTVTSLGGKVHGLAIGPSVPLVLQGASGIQSWAPSALPEVSEDYLARIQYMYQNDQVLNAALQEATGFDDEGSAGMKGQKGQRQFVGMMKTAASFMAKPTGARIASIDLTGWDTHAGQGTAQGRFAQVLKVLSEGVATFKTDMGPLWAKTNVLMITEFGRTVAVNGSGGTDHGTASAALLAGGNINGGRVLGDWPGLSSAKLYEERDLYPANDLRALIKGLLAEHMGLQADQIERDVFPQSNSVKPMQGIIRKA
jgi:uncharacterized protein (DUF1501 family)